MSETEVKKIKGEVVVLDERCKGCGFCVELCPAKCLELSGQYNSKGYHPPILKDKYACTGCDICGMVCPDFAIYGLLKKKEKKSAK